MATVWVECWKCELCGHRWIKVPGREPSHCSKCKRRGWHTRDNAPEQPIQSPADPAPVGIESLRQVIAAIERKPEPDSVPEPECEQCGYTEYVGELGETMRCGLAVHSGKVKHGNWQAIR